MKEVDNKDSFWLDFKSNGPRLKWNDKKQYEMMKIYYEKPFYIYVCLCVC